MNDPTPCSPSPSGVPPSERVVHVGLQRVALIREVSPAIGGCELTHLARSSIDLTAAQREHRAYCQLLGRLGCRLIQLTAEAELPDSVFVEDTAVVLDELTFLARPGATSRRGEVDGVATALAAHRKLVRCPARATLDGGDVLISGQRIYVGRSGRTDDAGCAAVAAAVRPFGYDVCQVPIRDCLHLKSAACLVAPGTILIQPHWVDPAFFQERMIPVHPSEPYAANALRVGNTVVHPAAYPRTAERLRAEGLTVAPVAMDELAKAEGGVTCCSIVFRS